MAGKKAIREIFENEATQSFDAYSAYGGGSSSDKLRKFWKPDGKNVDQAHANQLKKWMKGHGLTTGPGDITMFLHSQMFLSAWGQAVRDLGL